MTRPASKGKSLVVFLVVLVLAVYLKPNLSHYARPDTALWWERLITGCSLECGLVGRCTGVASAEQWRVGLVQLVYYGERPHVDYLCFR
jgi:hypothetical protein